MTIIIMSVQTKAVASRREETSWRKNLRKADWKKRISKGREESLDEQK